jgi:phage repressor protein C with HTH and peptisase S24 domain
MLPTLKHGQIVVFLRSMRLSEGDIVHCRIDGSDSVKRIIKLRPGEVWVEGDNKAASTDSRDFGWISSTSVIAKMLLTFPM